MAMLNNQMVTSINIPRSYMFALKFGSRKARSQDITEAHLDMKDFEQGDSGREDTQLMFIPIQL